MKDIMIGMGVIAAQTGLAELGGALARRRNRSGAKVIKAETADVNFTSRLRNKGLIFHRPR